MIYCHSKHRVWRASHVYTVICTHTLREFALRKNSTRMIFSICTKQHRWGRETPGRRPDFDDESPLRSGALHYYMNRVQNGTSSRVKRPGQYILLICFLREKIVFTFFEMKHFLCFSNVTSTRRITHIRSFKTKRKITQCPWNFKLLVTQPFFWRITDETKPLEFIKKNTKNNNFR